MQEFDVILIYPFVRKAPMFLNVIKHLSPHLRLGIYLTGMGKAEKFPELEEVFMGLCRRYGAEILPERGSYKCKVALVALIGFGPEKCQQIRESVAADQYVGLVMIGVPFSKERVESSRALGIQTVLVQDMVLFRKANPDCSALDAFELIEVGLPYGKYPVFEADEIPPVDFIVALPSSLSLPGVESRISFLRNVLRLLGRLPRGGRVFLKEHNAKKETSHWFYVDSGPWSTVLKLLPVWMLKAAVFVFSRLARIKPGFRILQCESLFYELNAQIPRLSKVTSRHILPLEFFLPHIKGGVITGRSSLVYGCLYARVPVYNCDDEEVRSAKPSSVDLYHEYCGVRPCRGNFVFDSACFDRIDASVREGDLVAVLNRLVQERAAA